MRLALQVVVFKSLILQCFKDVDQFGIRQEDRSRTSRIDPRCEQ